ncbi:MAG: RNA polymerase factor sigma-54 [Planctomycetes bacterium]|nr:RNA polymerase factor sigma-54 [Planctomycetota bacterium]
MKLAITQQARMEQRLVQSPQMIQAMQILQLPSLDLAERIEQELSENPCLEQKENGRVEEAPAEEQATQEEPVDATESPEQYAEQVEAAIESLLRRNGEIAQTRRTYSSDAVDRKQEALANTPGRSTSLIDFLTAQLHLLQLTERQTLVGEYIISSLDERGYLEETLEEIAEELRVEAGEEDITVDEVREMLAEIRDLGPPGIAARDLRECLLIQMDELGDDHHLARLLIDRHLDDVLHNRKPKIERETGRTMAEINAAIQYIGRLNPRPAGDFGDEPNLRITPDVIVEEIDGTYEIRLERGDVPELQISSTYRELLQKARNDTQAYEYLKRKIDSAKWFIDAIQQRQMTLYKISREVFRKQRDFLDHGISHLHPLKMQDVADTVGVHISTVSRAIAGKYAQTPRGIYALKWFFTGGTQDESGQFQSQKSIKQRIADIVGEEDKTKPLSDEEIAKELSDRDGVHIARRTVTKYRKALQIPSSNLRREFH